MKTFLCGTSGVEWAVAPAEAFLLLRERVCSWLLNVS